MIPARLLLGPWSDLCERVTGFTREVLAPVELPRVCDVRRQEAPPESRVRVRYNRQHHGSDDR